MRGGRDDGHVSPQLLLLLHPPLQLIMQPFSLQFTLVAKCLAYELMKKVRLLARDWPVDHCAIQTIGAFHMSLALSCLRFIHVATYTKLRQLRLDTNSWALSQLARGPLPSLQNIYWNPVTYYFSATSPLLSGPATAREPRWLVKAAATSHLHQRYLRPGTILFPPRFCAPPCSVPRGL